MASGLGRRLSTPAPSPYEANCRHPAERSEAEVTALPAYEHDVFSDHRPLCYACIDLSFKELLNPLIHHTIRSATSRQHCSSHQTPQAFLVLITSSITTLYSNLQSSTFLGRKIKQGCSPDKSPITPAPSSPSIASSVQYIACTHQTLDRKASTSSIILLPDFIHLQVFRSEHSAHMQRAVIQCRKDQDDAPLLVISLPLGAAYSSLLRLIALSTPLSTPRSQPPLRHRVAGVSHYHRFLLAPCNL